MARESWQTIATEGGQAVLFDEVEANPRTTTAERIAQIAIETGRDLIVAIGGGSSLEAAKAAAMLATNGGRAIDHVGQQDFAESPLPFVAIPTTCGTGSEVTWVAVLTDQDRKRKISLKGPPMFPTVALVDSDFLGSLPSRLLAATALDALTHALEATTGRRRNPISDALAEKAIVLLLENLQGAWDGTGGAAAREAVMRASTLAGLAFGNSDVGAVHCLSESLGGLFDLPHGLCNAVLLGPVLRAHGASIEDRLAEIDAIANRTHTGSAERLLGRVEGLVAAVGIPGFASLGVEAEDHTRLAEEAVRNGSNASNPRTMEVEDYLSILQGMRSSTG